MRVTFTQQNEDQRVTVRPIRFPLQAERTFVPCNGYIRLGIWIDVLRLLLDGWWECAELISTPERGPGFEYIPCRWWREIGGEGPQLPPPRERPKKSTAWTRSSYFSPYTTPNNKGFSRGSFTRPLFRRNESSVTSTMNSLFAWSNLDYVAHIKGVKCIAHASAW